MLTPCTECSHAIWSEVRSFGSSRTVVHFDDDEQSVTYSEHVSNCTGCGCGLRNHVVLDVLKRVPQRRLRINVSGGPGRDAPEG